MRFNHLLVTITLFFSVHLSISQPFITTWKTDNPGISGSTEITIPTVSSESYNYDVDWDNDGVFDEFGITGDVTHDFGSAGTYTIRIQGNFPQIRFSENGGVQKDGEKLIDINQWGSISWTSMSRAFSGCSNLNVSAVDSPDLSGVSSLFSMFSSCSSLDFNLNWDLSSVTVLSSMFRDCDV
ncbi:MAG: BspA family leucine-rich repeat surface protein, partial [Cyclobacteriaceae bacterium]